MLGKNSHPVFVIKSGMATPEFREELPDTPLEFSGFCYQQPRGSLVNESCPRVVAHTADVDVMLQNQLLNGSQDFGAFL